MPNAAQLAMMRSPYTAAAARHDDRDRLFLDRLLPHRRFPRSRRLQPSLIGHGDATLITASQLRAARALVGMDQKTLAEKAGVSLPTIQRMEASQGNVRGVVDTLTKIINALDAAGVELIGENMPSYGTGRGVRLKSPPE